MFRAPTLRETTGKARVPGQHNKVTLKADSNGLRPSDDHTGVCKYSESSRLTGVRQIIPPVSGDDTTRPPTGKRHLSATNTSNSEATRRVEGRIGVKKCWNSSTSVSSRRTWGEDDVTPQQAVDKVGPNKLCSTHTAEQKAERYLQKVAAGNSDLQQRIEKAKADGSLIKLSEQLHRQERVREAQLHRDPMSMSPLRHSSDLGVETKTRPPFAVANQDEAPANTHSKRTFDVQQMAERRNAEAARKERMRNGVYRHSEVGRPLPFDTDNGEAAYPEPPSFGKSVPFNARHMGKARPDAVRTDGTSADMDTLSIQRAVNKAQRSNVVAHAKNPQDFIFGNIPPPSPSKSRSLAEQHEMKYAQNNERPHTAGKGHNPRAYQKTSLW